MTYVCYIDVLFLVNWMMNVVILLLTGGFWRRQISPLRIGMAAAAGGLWACLSAVMLWEGLAMRLVCWWMDWLVLPVLMIRMAYPDREWRELLRGCLCLYLAAILLGGVIHAIWENTSLGHFWQVWMVGSIAETISVWLLALSMLSAMAAIELGRRYRDASSRREQIQEVILYTQDRQWKVKALWDSGNQLRDPYSGKAVHIVEAKELKQLLSDGAYRYLMCYLEQGATMTYLGDMGAFTYMGQQTEPVDRFCVHLIPCRSLGSTHTLLPVFSITKIRLADGSLLTEPLIGLSSVPLSEDGSYGMLLHSQTDEMRRNQ